MIIDCQYNPNDLIEMIGDKWFSVCDGYYEIVYKKGITPDCVSIIDRSGTFRIDISSPEFEQSMQSARSMCILLNQKYEPLERP